MTRLTQCAALALAAVVATPVFAKTPDDTLVWAGNLDSVITLDPAQIGEFNGAEIMLNVCDPLVRLDLDDLTKVNPGLAESWSRSADGKVLTFRLHADLKFPSGKPATAHDLAWSIQRVLNLNLANAANLREWGFAKETAEQAFRASDDRTLVVTMDRPYPPNLILSALFSTISTFLLDREELLKHVKDNDYGNAWLKTTSACVGPYKVRTFNANDVVILERNDVYYGEKPKLRRVILRHVPESGAERLQLENGDIDVARLLNADDLLGVAANKSIHIQPTVLHAYFYLAINGADPILGNPKVRLALRYLVDYAGMEQTVMKNLGTPRSSLVPIGAFGALSREEGAPFRLDLDKAKQLLTEAGYPNGFSKTLMLLANTPNPALAQHIQANAAKVGINLKLETLPEGTLFSKHRARDFEIALTQWFAGYPDANAMISRHAFNPDKSLDAKLVMLPVWRSIWQDTAINEMAETAKMEPDPQKRIAIYRTIQEKMMQDGPMVYLFQVVRSVAVRNEVKGFKMSPFHVSYGSAYK